MKRHVKVWLWPVLVAVLSVAVTSCAAKEDQASEQPSREGVTEQAPGQDQAQAPAIPVEEMPKLLSSEPPDYPEEARANGVEGTVFVRALVGKDGTVQSATSDPAKPAPAVLEKAAVDAVRGWTFSPAKSKGDAVETWVVVPVRFVLDSDSKKTQ
ncbi:MAG: energy transducer TonB [Candidatus Eisenbacteria bacterium]|nr:energy transducer TonB [Candidatus Eisenbacteria bacterium]